MVVVCCIHDSYFIFKCVKAVMPTRAVFLASLLSFVFECV